MIPKPLSEISWADIEAIRDSGREEDDTIEYKGSFSGGTDFLALAEAERRKAVASIAQEALAFLNGRGGDIVIGAKEFKNDHPAIEAITPVVNVSATADRLAQSLAAVIEPAQALLGIRAIRRSDNADEGVIIVRAPSSLRAPHRFTGNKECYIRRGRESVPMPMDEIQDVTLGRLMRRSERTQMLDAQFEGMADGRFGTRTLPSPRFAIRTVFVPYAASEHILTDELLSMMGGSDPCVYSPGRKPLYNDVAFRSTDRQWKAVMRGRQRLSFAMSNDVSNMTNFRFNRKIIRTDGVCISDMAICARWDQSNLSRPAIHIEYVIGYFANVLTSFQNISKLYPAHAPGVLRCVFDVSGENSLIEGENGWETSYLLPIGQHVVPDFDVSTGESYEDIFGQIQRDFYALVEKDPPIVWSLTE